MLKIRELPGEVPVYDITVEDNENFFANNINVHNCSEITLHTDENHSFVCCLSSLNLAKYDEWKDSEVIYYSTIFLDGVMEEFIQRAKNMRGFDNAVRSAEKGRALGLGVLGWHTLLQQEGIPFEGLLAQHKTREIFSNLKLESERASRWMAEEYGEPLWCIGTGMRNTHLRAIAPTTSNSKLAGGISAGIEPVPANVYTDQSAKGTFIRKNGSLEKYLKRMKLDTAEIWDKILEDEGSIQHIDIFDQYGFLDGKLVKAEDNEDKLEDVIPFKEVFKTFREINQLDLINQAGLRQQYIDQSVSLNIAFPKGVDAKWLNRIHLEAWKQGVKTLYYMRTTSQLRGDVAKAAMDSCLSCDG